jgi:tetratricopeptide (TPR) repeat protein
VGESQKGQAMKTSTVSGGFVHSRRVGLFLGVFLLGLTLLPSSSSGADAATLGQLQAEMRAKQFSQAIITADALIAAKDAGLHEATYLKALALFHAGKFSESTATAELLLAQDQKSDWYYKALYLKAQSLVEQRRFKDAAGIYEAEANRILSPQRKQELAGVIIQFADKLTVKPAVNDPGASPPDFNKAYGLYQKALTMEIGRDLRDEVMFKKARAIQQAGNAGQAVADFQGYLSEFDSAWTGFAGAGSTRQVMQNPLPNGQKVLSARYFLADALIQGGNPQQARLELEDLLKLLSASAEARLKLKADIQWLQVQSFFTVRPGDGTSFMLTGGDLESAIKTCRDFLAANPVGTRAIRAAWMMIEAHAAAGRSDAAIAACHDFIASKGFQLPEGEEATKIEEEIHAAPATYLSTLRMRALFRIGQTLFAQKKYGDAIAIWQSYIKEYPNGSQWSESQSAIVNAEFQTGMDLLADKKTELAETSLETFLRDHPLDESRARQILYIFGAIHDAKAGEMATNAVVQSDIKSEYRQAIDTWSRLAEKYPGSVEANQALFRSAVIMEEKLGDFEKALALYRRLVSEFGYDPANQRISDMTRKTMSLSSERVFRTNEKPFLRLKSRNLEKVTVRLYKLDLQAYFRKMHGITGIEALDLSLIQPDKTWEVKVAEFAKYKPLEQEIEIPFEAATAGACAVTVGDDEQESTVLVLRSDIEVVVKSSRREILAFAQDMLTGKPAADVEVLVSDGITVPFTGKTGADGVFKGAADKLKEIGTVRVFAIRGNHAAAYNLDLAGLGLTSGLMPKGFLYTDRPAYLPGETVSLRGILREIRKASYAVPENAEFTVSFTDPQGRMLSEQIVKLSKFGTFDAVLALPAAAPVGMYTIAARQERKGQEPLNFSGSFEVRQFKLEKIRLAMEFPRRVYFRGENVECTVKAQFYWGEPVVGRTLRYNLPDGRSHTATTDAEGNFKFTFDTTSLSPGSTMAFFASLEGENVAVAETLTLARLGFSIIATPSQPLVLAGEPFDLGLTTAGADGKPIASDLTVAVLRLEQPKPSPVIASIPWLGGIRTLPSSETTIEEKKVATDAVAGKANLLLKLMNGGDYRIRVTGVDRFGQTVTSECTVQVSGVEDAIKLRFFTDSATLQVGREAVVRLHSRLDRGLALLTYEGETLLNYQILELKKEYNDIPVKVGHDLFPNFRLAAAVIDGRELRTATKEFTVERELKVSVKPIQSVWLPGETGRVEIAVTDQAGKPVEAEFSLALVNEALYAVCPDRTAKILEFFQASARRHAEFRTGASCGFHHDGTVREIAKELREEESRVVRDLSERMMRKAANKEVGDSFAYAVAAPASVDRLDALDGDEKSKSEVVSLEMVSDEPILNGLAKSPVKMKGLYSSRAAGGRKGALSAFGGSVRGLGREARDETRHEVRGEGRWLPSVITGPDGKVVATVKMPETTTEWRLTARGCSVETLVGEATAQTLTRKDFFVELKAPAFLREGDELRAVGRIHNLTTNAGLVKLVLNIRDAKDKSKLLASREKSVEIKANGGAEVTFDAITVPASVLELEFELVAESGSNRDALAQAIPVKPWGLEYAAHAGGTAVSDIGAVVGLPGSRAYSSTWMTVSVGPDIRTTVLDMALRRYWFGPCDALARICPPVWGEHPANELLAVASALAYANQGRVEEPYRRQLAEHARTLAASLVASQESNGSWVDARGLGSLVTARAFWALVAARDAGIAVNDGVLIRAANRLQQQFQSCDANDNDTKAVLLHALSTDKRADFANCNRLYRDRNGLGNATLAYLAQAFFNLGRQEIATELAAILEGKAKITPGQEPIPLCWESGCRLMWLNDTDETTALVLAVLAQTKPDSKVADSAVQYLIKSHGCFGFPTARARGPAVAALATYFGKGLEQATDMEITIVANGREVGSVKANGSQGLKLFQVTAGVVKAEKNLVEFKMKGRGKYSYAVTLFGFSPDTKPTDLNIIPTISEFRHLHAPLEYRGRAIGAASSSPVKSLENGQPVVVQLVRNNNWYFQNRQFVMDIPLPAGARLVEGTLIGDYGSPQFEVDDSVIHVYFSQYIPMVSYQLTGYVSGKFRILPPVIREVGNPAFMTVGPTPELTVLAVGEKSTDPYQMNDAERYALGKCYFDDGDYSHALEHLAALFKSNRQYNEAELARMLLWCYTTPKFYDARKIVELFEGLRERYPKLEIPFDRILTVGRAYKDIGEFERSWLVYRAAIGASFANDSSISAILEDEGRFLGSIAFQERIWREYPDTAEVVSSYFAISQFLYRKAPLAHELPKEDGVQPEKIAMLKRTAELLGSFLTLYPKDPLCDQAGFSLANAMLDLKNYPLVVRLSQEFAQRYTDSKLAPSLQYMTALGLFWQGKYSDALAAAKIVAEGDSKDRDFARYILGQICHAEGKPAVAIEWYGKVKTIYPDAAEAIAYFEEKRIAMDEVTIVKPGEKVALTLKYRNIKNAFLQVYRVDLMKLYLQQKNLSKITSVQLAGIKPEVEATILLGEGRDYAEKERKIELALKDEAAYLIICRGDDLFASGMVLITPLKIEIQEETASGRIRANVLDAVKGGYRPEVHVKAIGSADSKFRSGETDLRGIFTADNLRGKATVIAREGTSRYAFFRGEQWLGALVTEPAQDRGQAGEKQQIDYQGNLNGFNATIQMENSGKFDQNRRQRQQKGIQADQAY